LPALGPSERRTTRPTSTKRLKVDSEDMTERRDFEVGEGVCRRVVTDGRRVGSN
jgi:hypothetical protein